MRIRVDASKFNRKNRLLILAITKLPKEVANIQKNFFKRNFYRQGFLGVSLRRWKKRKGNFEPTRAILTLSGDLRDSIQTIGLPTLRKIATGTVGIPYAERHNKGLQGMPKRQFMGKSEVLKNKIKKHVKKSILKPLRA